MQPAVKTPFFGIRFRNSVFFQDKEKSQNYKEMEWGTSFQFGYAFKNMLSDGLTLCLELLIIPVVLGQVHSPDWHINNNPRVLQLLAENCCACDATFKWLFLRAVCLRVLPRLFRTHVLLLLTCSVFLPNLQTPSPSSPSCTGRHQILPSFNFFSCKTYFLFFQLLELFCPFRLAFRSSVSASLFGLSPSPHFIVSFHLSLQRGCEFYQHHSGTSCKTEIPRGPSCDHFIFTLSLDVKGVYSSRRGRDWVEGGVQAKTYLNIFY